MSSDSGFDKRFYYKKWEIFSRENKPRNSLEEIAYKILGNPMYFEMVECYLNFLKEMYKATYMGTHQSNLYYRGKQEGYASACQVMIRHILSYFEDNSWKYIQDVFEMTIVLIKKVRTNNLVD